MRSDGAGKCFVSAGAGDFFIYFYLYFYFMQVEIQVNFASVIKTFSIAAPFRENSSNQSLQAQTRLSTTCTSLLPNNNIAISRDLPRHVSHSPPLTHHCTPYRINNLHTQLCLTFPPSSPSSPAPVSSFLSYETCNKQTEQNNELPRTNIAHASQRFRRRRRRHLDHTLSAHVPPLRRRASSLQHASLHPHDTRLHYLHTTRSKTSRPSARTRSSSNVWRNDRFE